MTDPAYVSIAGDYARRIRNGTLSAGTQLPSYADIAKQNNVSDIVVRKAIELLQSQGLVRSVRRRGIFVTDRPNLIRVAPERQMEDPETTFSNESNRTIKIHRETEHLPATDALADTFQIATGETVTRVITRASEDGRPISISDTYQPASITGLSDAVTLEETIADRLPKSTHGDWLRVAPGDLVKTVHQKFLNANGVAIMISDISYPRERYDAFVFRMTLSPEETTE